MRKFESGATRDSDDSKPDYEGFFSPLVLVRYGEYMQQHQVQADGNVRASDNWQKGMPLAAYLKSAFRHFMDWWQAHRHEGHNRVALQDALCALLFNVMGYLHVLLCEERDDTHGVCCGGPMEPMPTFEEGMARAEKFDIEEDMLRADLAAQGPMDAWDFEERIERVKRRLPTNTEPFHTRAGSPTHKTLKQEVEEIRTAAQVVYDPSEGGKPGI